MDHRRKNNPLTSPNNGTTNGCVGRSSAIRPHTPPLPLSDEELPKSLSPRTSLRGVWPRRGRPSPGWCQGDITGTSVAGERPGQGPPMVMEPPPSPMGEGRGFQGWGMGVGRSTVTPPSSSRANTFLAQNRRTCQIRLNRIKIKKAFWLRGFCSNPHSLLSTRRSHPIIRWAPSWACQWDAYLWIWNHVRGGGWGGKGSPRGRHRNTPFESSGEMPRRLGGILVQMKSSIETIFPWLVYHLRIRRPSETSFPCENRSGALGSGEKRAGME